MKRFIPVFTCVLVLFLVVSVYFNIALAAENTSEPGSEQDPIVSKSYVDASVGAQAQELKAVKEENARLVELINQQNEAMKVIQTELEKMKTIQAELGEPKPAEAGTKGFDFETVTVKAGKALFTGMGTEVILRSGKAVALKGSKGSLADITAAKDLPVGTALTANHLNISSYDDGQGLKAATQCLLMVRGSYKLGEPPAGIPDTATKDPVTPRDPVTTTPGSIGAGTVDASSLNVRSQANTTSAVAAKVVKGESVTVISKSGEWYKIKTSKGISGWVFAKYIVLKK